MSNLTSMVGVLANGTSFNGTATPVSGIPGTFGGYEILGISAIVIMFIIGIKMKVSPDLLVVSCVSMLALVTMPSIGSALLPEWTFWIFTITGGIVFALGLIKVLKHR